MAGTIDGPRQRGREREKERGRDTGVVAVAVTEVGGEGPQCCAAWTMTKKANAVVAQRTHSDC